MDLCNAYTIFSLVCFLHSSKAMLFDKNLTLVSRKHTFFGDLANYLNSAPSNLHILR
jgi:hypothetical protein